MREGRLNGYRASWLAGHVLSYRANELMSYRANIPLPANTANPANTASTAFKSGGRPLKRYVRRNLNYSRAQHQPYAPWPYSACSLNHNQDQDSRN